MKKTILLAALMLSATTAFAGTGYAGVSAGSSTQKLSFDGESGSKDTAGFKAFAGYQINPSFGIEGGYVHFGDAKESEDGATVSIKPKSFYAALTGTAPMSPQFNLFAKLGIARTETTMFASFDGESGEVDVSDTSPMVGIGAEYKFSQTMSVIAEYEHFGKVAKESDMNLKASMVSIGLRISF
jgi:OOP family OmpA-OmpF porin